MFSFVLHRVLPLSLSLFLGLDLQKLSRFFYAINSLFETDSVFRRALFFAILASVDEAAKKAHKNSGGRKPDRRFL